MRGVDEGCVQLGETCDFLETGGIYTGICRDLKYERLREGGVDSKYSRDCESRVGIPR